MSNAFADIFESPAVLCAYVHVSEVSVGPGALLAHPCSILRFWQVSQGLLTHFQAHSSRPHRHDVCMFGVFAWFSSPSGRSAYSLGLPVGESGSFGSIGLILTWYLCVSCFFV